MSEVTLYSLEFLIDGAQVSLDDLKKKAAKAMHRHGSNVDWHVTQTASQHLKLSIRGPLEDVDTCHLRLNDELVGQYSCIRLRDEAGDEIRQRAYPVLARIEQQLRTFINRAMTEVKGFDWWESITPALTPQRIREDVQKVEDRIGKVSSTIHHPLELALFDDLIPFVTGSIQQWPEHKPLSASELLEILSDCSSIEDIQEKLAEKMRKISLWDEVFARYFKNADQWKELEETITGLVIPVRNKVMHHRPMHFWELQELQQTEEKVDALLASARKELSEEERIEARQVSEEWARAWSRTIAELAPPPRLLAADLMKPFFEQQEEFSRAISEQIGRTVQQIAELAPPPRLLAADLMKSFFEQQEEFSRAINEQIGRTVQQMVESLRDQQEQIAQTAQQMTQLPASGTAYVGSTDSVRFHLPACRHARRILPENLTRFASRDEAVAKGYVPCEACRP